VPERVGAARVTQALQLYLGSGSVNDFTAFGRNWQVTVQADAPSPMNPADIGRLKVPNAAGEMVPLVTLVSVSDASNPAVVNHYSLFIPGPPHLGAGPRWARRCVRGCWG
jgi:multidrug efflux pump subunit AcrB